VSWRSTSGVGSPRPIPARARVLRASRAGVPGRVRIRLLSVPLLLSVRLSVPLLLRVSRLPDLVSSPPLVLTPAASPGHTPALPPGQWWTGVGATTRHG